MSVAEQQMVSVPDTSALFMARRGELRLVRKAIRQTRDAEGRPAETIPGETIAFHDGVLRVPHEGTIRLTDGRETEAAGILDWLEAHPLKGDVQEGFWRVDPTAPAPSQAELDKLQELAMELDVAGLEAFIEQESAGWARESLLDVATRTIERAREKLKESDARREAALEQARAEGRAEAAPPKGKTSG
jgi:hypothetical protein